MDFTFKTKHFAKIHFRNIQIRNQIKYFVKNIPDLGERIFIIFIGFQRVNIIECVAILLLFFFYYFHRHFFSPREPK